MNQSKPVHTLLDYVSADAAVAKDIHTYLDPLIRANRISLWSSQELQGGDPITVVGKKHWEQARIVLVLLSPEYLAQKGGEIPQILERCRFGVTVVPVLVRSCHWHRTDFNQLSPLPARNGVPTFIKAAEWSTPEDALCAIAEGVERILDHRTESEPEKERSRPPLPGGAFHTKWYISRGHLEQNILEQLEEPGTPAILTGPNGSGKTWLARKVSGVLQEGPQKSRVLYVDLAGLSTSDRGNAVLVFRYLATSLASGVAPDQLTADAWVSEHFQGNHSPGIKLREFVKSKILDGLSTAVGYQRILIVLDHINEIENEEILTDLFSQVRLWSAATDDPWQRLRMILLGTSTVAVDPIKQSPLAFSAMEIQVGGLSRAAVGDLFAMHNVQLTEADYQAIAEEVDGNPHLCKLIARGAADMRVSPKQWLERHALDRLQREMYLYLTRPLSQDSALQDLLCRVMAHPEQRMSLADEYRLLRSGLLLWEGDRYKMRYRLYERHLQALCRCR